MSAKIQKTWHWYILASALFAFAIPEIPQAWAHRSRRHHAPPRPPEEGKIEHLVFGPISFFIRKKCEEGHDRRHHHFLRGKHCFHRSKHECEGHERRDEDEVKFNISNLGFPFVLHIRNNGAKQAKFELNDRDFNEAFREADSKISIPVRLKSRNELEVEVKGREEGSSITVWITALTGDLPPDPVQAAPPLSPTTPTTFAQSTAFLYSGPNPIQTGVASGTIQARTSSVLRGRTLAVDGSPLSGVLVSILNHPELGQTASRSADPGRWDLAVNGGDTLTVVFSKPGYSPVQRSVYVPWQDYVMIEDVLLTQADSAITRVELGASSPVQVHQPTTVTDQDGSRRSTLIFPPGTTATLSLPGGSTSVASTLTVRATEFTIGPNGPKAMPAILPETSAYTFAAELSADEAIAAGASSVTFNHPIYHYLDNFLGFSVGMPVPVGFYKREEGRWIPGASGRVVRILSVSGGLANLDFNGNGQAATAAELAQIGFTNDERQQLASLYPVNKTLWRLPVPHFSLIDANGGGGSLGATASNTQQPGPRDAPLLPIPPTPWQPAPGCGDVQHASVVNGLSQTVREDFPVVGTPYRLVYSSDRNPGRKSAFTVDIPITPSQISSELQEVELFITIAGQAHAFAFPPLPDQTFSFTWDGKDAYGRDVPGTTPVRIDIKYLNRAVYLIPPPELSPGSLDFGLIFPRTPTLIPTRVPAGSHVVYRVPLGVYDARLQNLGGVDFDVHHAFDPASGTLYFGDGGKRSFSISDAKNVSLFAGNGGTEIFPASGGPATATALQQVRGLARRFDGSILIAGSNWVQRVQTDGTIWQHQFAIQRGPLGDEIVPYDFTNLKAMVASDRYVTWFLQDQQLLFAWQGPGTFRVTGIPGGWTNAQAIAAQSDWTVYLLDSGKKVWMGGTESSFTMTLLSWITDFIGSDTINDIQVTPEGGSLYLGMNSGRLWEISSSSAVTDLNPGGQSGILKLALSPTGRVFFVSTEGNLYQVSQGRAFQVPTLAPFTNVSSLLVDQNDDVYLGQVFLRQVRRVHAPSPVYPAQPLSIASSDASEIYDFDTTGRHLRTRDALTDATKLLFSYGPSGLESIVDAFGNLTQVLRAPDGAPEAILSPDGLRTELRVNPERYLSSIANPNAETFAMTYVPGTGLLADLIQPNPGEVSRHAYDEFGRLISDQDASGATLLLSSIVADQANGISLTATMRSPEGISTEYRQNQQVGSSTQAVLLADGTSSTNQSDGKTNLVIGNMGSQFSSTMAEDPRFGTQASFPASTRLTHPSGLIQEFETRKSVTYQPVTPPLAPAFVLEEITQRFFSEDHTDSSRADRTYNSATRTWTETDFAGRPRTTVLNESGQIAGFSRPEMASIDYAYDLRGRLSSVAQGDRFTQYGYSPRGFLESVLSPEIGATRFEYDGAGRVTRTLFPDGVRELLTGYDPNGNVTSITPPGRPAWFFERDAVGNATQVTPPAAPGPASLARQSRLYLYFKRRGEPDHGHPDGRELSACV